MARFALVGFNDGAGPLSPNVFWWQDGRWAQMTQRETDGTVSIIDNPKLIRMVQRIDDR